MTLQTLQTQYPAQHPDHPSPIVPVVTETRCTAERWIPETHYLTIVDPTRLEREQDFSRLMVKAHHRQKCEEILIDFRSNNTDFRFVLNALRQHSKGMWCFVESWEPEASEPF
jgi:hypothetical protein